MRFTGITLAALLLLTSCGNSDNGPSYDSANAVAKAAGCTNAKASPAGEVTLFATQEVQCQAGGFTIVDWFKDGDSLASFKRASKGAGYRILYGPNWAISCVDAHAGCAAIEKRIGGTLE